MGSDQAAAKRPRQKNPTVNSTRGGMDELRAARLAALNLIEDALAAREEAERAAAALRESEARHAYLLMLGDAIRPLDDPLQIQLTASRVLGEYLEAPRVAYAEVDGDHYIVGEHYSKGAEPIPRGRYPVGAYGRRLINAFRAGLTVVIDDCSTDEGLSKAERLRFRALGIAGMIGVPLLKNGELVAVMSVNDVVPRAWTRKDVELVQETAERTWASVLRARTERELRRSRELLQKALSAETVGVLFFRLDGTITQVNGAFERMSGYTREDLLKLDWATLTPAEFQAVTDRAVTELAGTGYTNPFEKQMVRPDGSRWWGLFAPTRLAGEGREAECVEFIIDITDRKLAEKRQRASEERLRLVSESFLDFAIFTTDAEGSISSWNPGAQKIFGYSEDEILGRNGRILFTPEDQRKGESEKEIETARTRGRAADERWHIRKDGTRFYASGIMAPLYDGEELIGFAKIARDLTREKKMQEELRRQYDELETIVAGRTAELAEANGALKDQMKQRRKIEEERFALLQRIVTTQEDERRRIARDMHDSLGQQLTALRLKLASLTDDDHPGDERLRANIERLQQLGAKVDAEVNFLVWELRPTVLDDLGLVAAIENYALEWSKHYGVAIEVHTARFRNQRLQSEVETNLYRIVQEALNNVHKHAQATNVNIVVESRKQEIVLVVEDDGVGFDADAERVRESGRGLGLVGMRERAAIIGGKVEIESVPGNGTAVFVRVPARKKSNNGGTE